MGFLDPVWFSLAGGLICLPSKSREVLGGGDSGATFFVIFIESDFGGAPSESEEAESSESTG